MYALKVKPALSTGSAFTVAIATVHRFVTAGFKGYLGILATLGAYCREHLALGSVTRAIIPITLRFLPCLSTRGAALGLIGVASGLEKLLLFNAEGKGSPAIGTLERLVLKTHGMISFFLNSWL
jgi:hypothetical protein